MNPVELELSNSKAKTFRRCPKQYEFRYVHKLKLKRKGVALERGSWLHDLLMYHADEEDWRARHAELTRDFYNLFEEEREHLGDMPDECERIMKAYIMHYKKTDTTRRVIDTEIDEVITMPNGLRFRFIIDQIYEDQDGYWLKDYKTVKSFMDSDFMLLDAQLTRYFWCAEQMGYAPLMGVEFDELRTKAPWVPEPLKTGGLSKKQNMDTDVYTYLQAIKQHDLEVKDYRDVLLRLKAQTGRFFRRSKLPKDKPITDRMMQELVMTANDILRAERKEEFPRTPDKSCTWGCDYTEPCITELQGGDWSSVAKLKYTTTKRGEL